MWRCNYNRISRIFFRLPCRNGQDLCCSDQRKLGKAFSKVLQVNFNIYEALYLQEHVPALLSLGVRVPWRKYPDTRASGHFRAQMGVIGKAKLPLSGDLGFWCTSSGSPWFYKPEGALTIYLHPFHRAMKWQLNDQWYFEHMFLDMTKVNPVSLRVHINRSIVFYASPNILKGMHNCHFVRIWIKKLHTKKLCTSGHF